jgi:hypothetical protein
MSDKLCRKRTCVSVCSFFLRLYLNIFLWRREGKVAGSKLPGFGFNYVAHVLIFSRSALTGRLKKICFTGDRTRSQRLSSVDLFWGQSFPPSVSRGIINV